MGLGSLATKQVCDEEPDIGRPFRQSAHEIWVPLRAEWNVDADRVAAGEQVPAEFGPYTMQ